MNEQYQKPKKMFPLKEGENFVAAEMVGVARPLRQGENNRLHTVCAQLIYGGISFQLRFTFTPSLRCPHRVIPQTPINLTTIPHKTMS